MADFWNRNATPQTAAASNRARSAFRRDITGFRFQVSGVRGEVMTGFET
jgi:hypothetical protein